MEGEHTDDGWAEDEEGDRGDEGCEGEDREVVMMAEVWTTIMLGMEWIRTERSWTGKGRYRLAVRSSVTTRKNRRMVGLTRMLT